MKLPLFLQALRFLLPKDPTVLDGIVGRLKPRRPRMRAGTKPLVEELEGRVLPATNFLNVGAAAATTTTVIASQSVVMYGAPVTFTASVTASASNSMGTVDFIDDTTGTELGHGTLQNSGGNRATWTYTTTATQLQASPAPQIIRAVFTSADGTLSTSQGTLPGGLTVSPLPLVVSGIIANDKTYDATTHAYLYTGSATLSAALPGDNVGLDPSAAVGTFANANVGSNIPVTISGLSLIGPQANDYIVTPPNASASIVPARLSVTGMIFNDKVYDGTTGATVNAAASSLSGVFSGDMVTLNDASVTATFTSKNVGVEVPVIVSGLTLAGAQAKDYRLAQPTSRANITPAPLTITAVTNTKAYDGTTSAAAVPTVTGLIGSDTVTGLAEVYDNANPGSGKTLSVIPAPSPSATLGWGLNTPVALAFDAGGNLFVSNSGAGTITKFAPGATTPSAVLTGLHVPGPLAFDPSGNLFVINGGFGGPYPVKTTVVEFARGATTPSAILGGLNDPSAMAIDSSGNLYVADFLANSVSKFAPGTSVPEAILTGLTEPDALAFDGNGNLFVGSANGDTIAEFASGATTPTGTLTGVSDVHRLAFDPSGNLFALGSSLSKFSPGATTPSATLTGFRTASALAVDASGNLFVADGGAVRMFAPGATSPTASLTGVRSPSALAVDASGNLYVADFYKSTLSKFAPGATTSYATISGLGTPNALAFDGKGNLFVANPTNGTVSEFAPGATIASATITGLDGLGAMAFDARGDLFVANADTTVSEFAPGATTPTTSLTGLDGPSAMAFDSSGNLYVANSFNLGLYSTISKFAPGATTPSATLTGVRNPVALAFDAAGDLFVANIVNGRNDTVIEFAPGATTPTATLTGLNDPDALVFDRGGELYVSNFGNSTVSKFAPGATTPSATLTGLNRPTALVFDGRGNLYVANENINTVSEFAAGATRPGVTYTGSNGHKTLAVDALDNLYVANAINDTVTKFPAQLLPGYTINDGNNRGNYAVTLVSNMTGVIKPPLSASITYKTGYASITEPAAGASAPYYFTISLNAVPTKPITIYYQTRNGSATAGEDYRGVNNYRVTFPAFAHGATTDSPPSMDIAVTVNGDVSDGTDPETFSVVLTSAFNATINPSGKTATGTILPATPQAAGTKASIAAYSAAGPSAGFNVFDVPVTLDGPAAQAINIYYSTTDGTAKSGTDYVGQANGHVTIGAGDTSAAIPITILADAAGHTNRTFTITITQWFSAAVVSSTATVTIVYPPAEPSPVIGVDALDSWSNSPTTPSTDALDQVFTDMGANGVDK